MRHGGFTFIELVLVIGVFVMLGAAILPSLRGMREQALSAACRSNLHQLALVCLNYAQNDGYFPWGMIEPSTHDETYWDFELAPYVYPRENPAAHGVSTWRAFKTFCWDFKRAYEDKRGWRCGDMFGDVRADAVMCCPKCRQETYDNWDGNRMTGYNYNVCFLGYVENDKGQRKYPTPFKRVTRPSRVVVFGDGGYAGGPNKFMRAPFQDKFYDNSAAALRKSGTQAFRHGYGAKRHCNMAFLDGHVESFFQPYKAGGAPGWVDEASHTAFISSGNGIYGPRGFGETDDDEPRL